MVRDIVPYNASHVCADIAFVGHFGISACLLADVHTGKKPSSQVAKHTFQNQPGATSLPPTSLSQAGGVLSIADGFLQAADGSQLLGLFMEQLASNKKVHFARLDMYMGPSENNSDDQCHSCPNSCRLSSHLSQPQGADGIVEPPNRCDMLCLPISEDIETGQNNFAG